MLKIKLIVAVDSKFGISKAGKIPWHLPKDRQYFKEKIIGNTILMGRKTYENMPVNFPGTKYIVLSRQDLNLDANSVAINNLNQLLESFDGEIWVIGGSEVYKDTLAYADEIHITKIEADFNCDNYFPQIPDNFRRVDKNKPESDNGLKYEIQIWQKF